jgi:hypothetical protein
MSSDVITITLAVEAMSCIDVVNTEKSDVFWRHPLHSTPRFSYFIAVHS